MLLSVDHAVDLHVPRGVSAAGALPVRLSAARRRGQVAQREVRQDQGRVRYKYTTYHYDDNNDKNKLFNIFKVTFLRIICISTIQRFT